jgi:gamma-glutamyltranspeptidase/glutathione hydrolase
MQFTYSSRRKWENASRRSVAMGTHGMVASSQHLATLAGYKALAKGGNAVDAAVAMVSTLNVVEPHSVGLGGDAFALIYLAKENKLVGMNGSGRAPYRATIDWFRNHGMKEIPERGLLSATVPGALHGWVSALERYGTLTFGEVFEDAIHHAEQGFPVTEVIAGEWKHSEPILLSTQSGSETYLLNGRAPQPGQRFVNRDLARSYKTIVREGVKAFYDGEICDAIIDFSNRNQGLFSRSDFKDHTTTWVEPVSTDYRGFTVYELPPNGQGITALEILNILEGYEISRMEQNGPEYLHLLIEAKKAAFNDRDRYITDPEFADVPVSRILSKAYAGRIRERIHRDLASPPSALSPHPGGSETVYVTAVDRDRNAVSFISSIFMHFGSGVVVDGTGIILQNRGKSFSLDSKHFNRLEPHKRPMHTIIPGMVFKDGRFLMSFGVMGGDMQPQGHVQFLVNLIDFKLNLQEAVDAPRIRHIQGMEVYLEDGIPEKTRKALREKGHHVLSGDEPINQVGGGQAVYFDRDQDVLLGASDRRKDGCAMGY